MYDTILWLRSLSFGGVTGRETDTDRKGAPAACAHHNDLYLVGGKAYLEILNRFLSRVTKGEPRRAPAPRPAGDTP